MTEMPGIKVRGQDSKRVSEQAASQHSEGTLRPRTR